MMLRLTFSPWRGVTDWCQSQSLLIPLSRGSFDVIVGMDWLSKRKFVIVCHEKVVRIHLVPEATSVAKSRYRLAPLEMQELSEQLRELQDKANVVGDGLSRKERVKSRPVRGMILAAQSEVFKQENVLAERLHGLDPQMEKKRRECVLYGSDLGSIGRKCNGRGPCIKVLDASLHVPLDEIKVGKTLRFVEEPIENSDCEVKRLKGSRIVVVKVHLGSKRGL
ncbi:hypothetical protein Tco_0527024 [Tanacetum coccineum]